jgi:hypothetical protein
LHTQNHKKKPLEVTLVALFIHIKPANLAD